MRRSAQSAYQDRLLFKHQRVRVGAQLFQSCHDALVERVRAAHVEGLAHVLDMRSQKGLVDHTIGKDVVAGRLFVGDDVDALISQHRLEFFLEDDVPFGLVGEDQLVIADLALVVRIDFNDKFQPRVRNKRRKDERPFLACPGVKVYSSGLASRICVGETADFLDFECMVHTSPYASHRWVAMMDKVDSAHVGFFGAWSAHVASFKVAGNIGLNSS